METSQGHHTKTAILGHFGDSLRMSPQNDKGLQILVF